MSTHKIAPMVRISTIRGRTLVLAAALTGAALTALPRHAAGQSTLGVPFIGNNHLSFYSTALATDGVGQSTTTLFGGRFARRFGPAQSQSSMAVNAQIAARPLDGPTDGIADVSLTTSWTRRMDEITDRLAVSMAVGGSVLAWATENDDVGLAHISVPVSFGVSYDIRIGAATLSPFAAPAVAWYNTRRYLNDVRVVDDTGWDARVSTGASLSLRDIVLTAGGIRGEHGLPRDNRWTFAAGVSF